MPRPYATVIQQTVSANLAQVEANLNLAISAEVTARQLAVSARESAQVAADALQDADAADLLTSINTLTGRVDGHDSTLSSHDGRISGKTNLNDFETLRDQTVPTLLNGKADASAIPDVSAFVTQAEIDTSVAPVQAAIPDVSTFVTQAEIDTSIAPVQAAIPDVSTFVTQTDIDTSIAPVQAAIPDITGLASASDVEATKKLAEDAHVLLQGTASVSDVNALSRIVTHQAPEFSLPPSKGSSSFVPSTTTQGYLALRDSSLKTVNALVSMYASGLADTWTVDFVNAAGALGDVKNIDNIVATSATLDLGGQANTMVAVALESFKLEYIFSVKATTSPAAVFMWDITSSDTGYNFQYFDYDQWSNNNLSGRNQGILPYSTNTLTVGTEYKVKMTKIGNKLFVETSTLDGTVVQSGAAFTGIAGETNFGFLANPNIELRGIVLDEVSYNITDGLSTGIRNSYNLSSTLNSDLVAVGYFDHVEVFDISGGISKDPLLKFAAPALVSGSDAILSADGKYLLTKIQNVYLIYNLEATSGDGLAVSLTDSLLKDGAPVSLMTKQSGIPGVDIITVVEFNSVTRTITKSELTPDGGGGWTVVVTTATPGIYSLAAARGTDDYFIGVGVSGQEVKVMDEDFNVIGRIAPPNPFGTETSSDLDLWWTQAMTAELVNDTELSVYIGTYPPAIDYPTTDYREVAKLKHPQYAALYYVQLDTLNQSNGGTLITDVYTVDGDATGKMPNFFSYPIDQHMNLKEDVLVVCNRDPGQGGYYTVYKSDTTAHTLAKKSTVTLESLNRLTVSKDFVISNDAESGNGLSVMPISSLISGTKRNFAARPFTEVSVGADRAATVDDLGVHPLFGFTQAIPDSFSDMNTNKSITDNTVVGFTFDGKPFTWDAQNSKFVNGTTSGEDITNVVLSQIYSTYVFEYQGTTYAAWKGTSAQVSNWAVGKYQFTAMGTAQQSWYFPPFSATSEVTLSTYIITINTFEDVQVSIDFGLIVLA